MSTSASITLEESRQFAVLIARAWADPSLADAYKRDPNAVLSGAGIDLGSRPAPELPARPDDLASQPTRPAPELPARPDDLASQPTNSLAVSSSASSVSTVTCPCSACTASCACAKADISASQQEAMMKLADDPKGREAARSLMATWDVKLGTAS